MDATEGVIECLWRGLAANLPRHPSPYPPRAPLDKPLGAVSWS